ncbi:MAG TPA: TetR/AcrR family transcriptional regulator [Bacteroidales bacterium]|nr:TetR/AcrR family transcriptional regulator [Bacteroidales bacterium]
MVKNNDLNNSDKNTEKIILDAAKKVFLVKGFDGARMQEIADEAGINKALVHYYFRSKENLFDAIFKEAFQQFMPQVAEIVNSEESLIRIIEKFSDMYTRMLLNNPHLPMFILHEINRNPEQLAEKFRSFGVKPEQLVQVFQKKCSQENYRVIDPRHLIVNLLGLCIFPFVARPIIQKLIFNNNSSEYNKFLESRKKEVAEFIINAISIKK